MMSEVSREETRAYTRRLKKTNPGVFREFHRLENAKNILAETEFALKQAKREFEAATIAWDKVGKE